MNQHTAIARKPRSTKAAPKAASLQSIAQSARKAAGSMGRASAKAAEPLVASFKQEEPQTLAKMAMAALVPTLAPRLAMAALRFMARNPLVVAASVATFAAITLLTDEEDAAPAKAG